MANRFKEAPGIEREEIENEIETAHTEQATSSPRKKGGLAKSLTAVFGGNFLGNPKIINQLPFIFFISFIALFYIANGYWADDKIRQMNKITNELKELRTEQITVQSDLESVTNEVHVAEEAKKLGLEWAIHPPMKIVINDTLKLSKTGK
jgi:hypothetical protein